jgi:hypothetical protein
MRKIGMRSRWTFEKFALVISFTDHHSPGRGRRSPLVPISELRALLGEAE